METEKLLDNAKTVGEHFKEKLNELKQSYPEAVLDVRVAGLLIGVELKQDIAKAVFNNLFENGFLTSLCGGNTIRIAPPLIITKNDANLFVSSLATAIKQNI